MLTNSSLTGDNNFVRGVSLVDYYRLLRFLEKTSTDNEKFSYVPFGAGRCMDLFGDTSM